MIKTVNPATQNVIKEYPTTPLNKIDSLLEKAQQSFISWKRKSFAERKKPMLTLAKLLENSAEENAKIMAEEMGKPLNDAKNEILKCAMVARYYAEEAEFYLKDEIISSSFKKSYVMYEPIGIILGVMPWNYPFWQVFRYLVPNLMAGNGSILKHASNVIGCGESIVQLIHEAGFPQHLVEHIILPGKDVEKVIRHPLIKGVTLTGSAFAGSQVAKVAGEMIKKSVLELGGSDPYIVCEDADLPFAAEMLVKSRLINNGQTCISGKRFIIHQKVYQEFTHLYVEGMKKYHYGNPLNSSSKSYQLGPMARIDLRDELHQQVQKSISEGAVCLLGGFIPASSEEEKKGAYYPPTVLSDVTPSMTAFKDELFGPVAALIKAQNDNEAINLANNSIFGLGGGVFSKDFDKANLIARQMETGNVAINNLVISDPKLPFGGIKESGYGRELSTYGLREFTNIKTICS